MGKSKQREQVRKLKKSTLILGLGVVFAFSILVGVIGGAIGFGSMYPQLNLMAKPFVCPGKQMQYSQQVSEVGTASYYAAAWYCVDQVSGERIAVESNAVFAVKGLILGVAFFLLLLIIIYSYWNSSIGPAKNDGLRLW